MIPLMKSAFLNEFDTKRALADFILHAPRLSMDTQCAEFERQFSRYQDRKESILFNSGGSANLAMLQALKNLGRLEEGDKIGFSALTWSTNTMPIIQHGFVPVPIDCSRETLNIMSTNLLERLEQVPLKALFLTNVLGFLGDIEKVRQICDQRQIILIEDNCESLGSACGAGKAGNFGVGSTFSFFVAHHMSTIEGGMVCTDDEELAQMLRIVRANGWDRNLTAEQQYSLRKKHGITSDFQAKYTFYDLGYNLRPTEITGFLGQHQLRLLEANIATREKNFMMLETVSRKNPDLQPLKYDHMLRLSTFAYPVVCRSPELREYYLSRFGGAGIEVRPMIAGNMQRQPFYKKYVAESFELPETDFLHDCAFYCGNYPELSDMDIQTISSCLFKY